MAAPTFKKKERIVSKKLIETLFSGGDNRSVVAFPLRAVYRFKERQHGEAPAQVLISVSKKRFKHAVDRNRAKRQVREAYRLHKEILGGCVSADKQLQIAFLWLSDKHLPTKVVEARVVSLMSKIVNKQ